MECFVEPADDEFGAFDVGFDFGAEVALWESVAPCFGESFE